MLTAINLNYKLLFNTDKIKDVVFKRMLPSELTTHLFIAQDRPETTFSISHIFTQAALTLVIENQRACLAMHNPSPS